MNERLVELQNQEEKTVKELLATDIHTEWDKHSKLLKKIVKLQKQMEPLIIEENKLHNVYWDYDNWIYDMVETIPQHFELTGQERTRKFVEDLNKLHGVIVTEEEAGYELEIFTPYKVYIYRFNRGYGNYPITIHKGFIAPSGNTYKNRIFLATSTADMKARYHTEH